MKSYVRWVYYFLLSFATLATAAAPARLTDVLFSQGTTKDILICCFDKPAICIYEPSFSYERNENSIQQLVFFFPYLTTSKIKQSLLALHHLGQKGYKVTTELVNKPIRGLRIIITYDTNLITIASFIRKADNDQHVLKFEFCSKPYTIPPWLTPAVHQPRVMLKVSNTQLCALLQQQLTQAGCEVFTTPSQMYKADTIASAANLIHKPDLFMAIENSTKAQRFLVDKQQKWIIKQGSQAPETHAILDKYNNMHNTKNKQLAHILTKNIHPIVALSGQAIKNKTYSPTTRAGDTPSAELAHKLLIPLLEMPAIRMKIFSTQQSYLPVTQAITNSIMEYFKESGFSVT